MSFAENASNRSTITIAMAQILCIDGDRSGNFVRIENALKEAKKKKASIVCFPETCILGWTNSDAHQRAFPIPGKDSLALCKLAAKYQVFVCIGLAEKEKEKLYDSAILISDKGNILLKHRKINVLKNLMEPPYTEGQDAKVVETRFGTVGILICADTFDKASIKQMKTKKPDLLCVPYGWANAESKWPNHAKSLEATVSKAAKQLNCVVVGTNLVGSISKGPWAGMIYGGQSIASDPSGKVLSKAIDRDREVKFFSVLLGKKDRRDSGKDTR